MSSRNLEHLSPLVKPRVENLLTVADEIGLDLVVLCTLRTHEEQAKLYRNGRPLSEIKYMAATLEHKHGREDLAKILIGVGAQYGKRKITNAAPGQSAHNPWGVEQLSLAVDMVPVVHGKGAWNTNNPEHMKLWQAYGELSEEVGLSWSGNWKRFKEYAHVQFAGFNWRRMIMAEAPGELELTESKKTTDKKPANNKS